MCILIIIFLIFSKFFINNTKILNNTYIVILIFFILYNYFFKKCYIKNIYLNFFILIIVFINIFDIYFNNLVNFPFNIIIFVVSFIFLCQFIFINNLQKNKFVFIIFFVFYFVISYISYKLYSLKSNFPIIKNNTQNRNNKLKIAICISGRIDESTLENCYNSWYENIIKYYDCDIFMNVNKTNEYITNIIRPKRIELFDHKINKNNKLDPNSNLMFYRIYECNKYSIEYENKYNIKYDLIIKIRPDLLIHEPLYLENFNNNYIYSPICKDYDIRNIYYLGISDQLFISNRIIMNKICNIYNELEDTIYSNIDCQIPEITFLYYLRRKNIPIKLFYYKINISYYDKLDFYTLLKKIKKLKLIFKKDCYLNI